MDPGRRDVRRNLYRYRYNLKPMTFHEMVLGAERSNNWPYPYACGYVSGRLDAERGRVREHKTSEVDDYAKGYHKGYADFEKGAA